MSNNIERFEQAIGFSEFISQQYDELNTCTCVSCRLTDNNIENTLRIHHEIIEGLRRAYNNLVHNEHATRGDEEDFRETIREILKQLFILRHACKTIAIVRSKAMNGLSNDDHDR
jgi:hypothetical protein